MELIDYVYLLRRRWTVVVGLTLAGIAAGLAWTLLAPKAYQATSELFVGSTVTGGTSSTSGPAQSASNYVLARMASYAALVPSREVAEQAAASLPFPVSGSTVASEVTATVPTRTVLLQVTARDADPDHAAAIANAVATRLQARIQTLETPGDNGPSAVRVTVERTATAPGAPVSPSRTLSLGLGLVLGLGLGGLAAALLEQRAQREEDDPRRPRGRRSRRSPRRTAPRPALPETGSAPLRDDQPTAVHAETIGTSSR